MKASRFSALSIWLTLFSATEAISPTLLTRPAISSRSECPSRTTGKRSPSGTSTSGSPGGSGLTSEIAAMPVTKLRVTTASVFVRTGARRSTRTSTRTRLSLLPARA